MELITVEHAVNAFCDLIEEYCATEKAFDESDLYTALKRYAVEDTAQIKKLEELNSEMCSTIIHLDAHIRALEEMGKVKRI